MAKPLIIVESPTKERTLSRFLKGQYRIASSSGHIRDLPKSAMGVDIDDGFMPRYRVLPEKKKVVDNLKKAADSSETVYLASDPDREGEAIAWHLSETLKLSNAKRIEFNEITPAAVKRALENPRELDSARVGAYHARRVLDRLVGYELSPLLSRKVHRRGLSGGRVQSVALRLICEREREIEAFVEEEYWTIEAELSPKEQRSPFQAVMPFTKAARMDIGNADDAGAIVSSVRDATWRVAKVVRRERKRSPRPPLITSTLQRAASTRYGFSSQRTMRLAQSLSDGMDVGGSESVGLITYMRTDSVRVAESAQQSAREYLIGRFGEEAVPEKPPVYRSRRGAQDAHEAIRPTSVKRTPESMRPYLSADELKLYTLIWECFLASQMAPAILDTVTVDIEAGEHTFRATGSVVKKPGYMALQPDRAPAPSAGKDKKGEAEENGEDEKERRLPVVTEGQELDLLKLEPVQHFTQPPPRYSEATLVQALEENGIGRPSTYAPTVETIKARQYALIEDKRFRPTPLGFVVNDLLVKHFPDVINVEFTSRMESQLDSVEEEDVEWQSVVTEFWGPFHQTLQRAKDEMEDVRVEPERVDRECPKCGEPLVKRVGRYGEFVGCSGFPECDFIEREEGEDQETDEVCEECGKPMVRKRGRFGYFLGCSGYPECKHIKQPEGKKKAEPTGIKCLAEDCDGELMLRQARRGNTFYGCNRYPKCRFTSSHKPVGGNCPECGEHLVEVETDDGTQIKCSGRKCKYVAPDDGASADGETEATA